MAPLVIKTQVLDLLMGIGSTAIAEEKLGTNFVRFEIDKVYLDESISRVNVE